jgi:hypothetical protein
MPLNTRLTERLGIKHPVLLAAATATRIGSIANSLPPGTIASAAASSPGRWPGGPSCSISRSPIGRRH